MENLLKFVIEHASDDTSRLILDRTKYSGIDIELAVNCIESRRKLKGKVQEWWKEPGLVFPLKLSAEQCSSSATGQYKAELAQKVASKPEWSIADLTGGLGVDTWFFSKKASKVIYNEKQTLLCDAARHNFNVLGAGNIRIINYEAATENILEIIGTGTDIVYMDPARRGESGRKVFLIEECTPDALTLKDEIFRYTRHIIIKLSPMADISMVCERLGCTCREVHVVSVCGECKELLIWMDREWNDEYTISAVEIHNNYSPAVFTFRPSDEREFCNNVIPRDDTMSARSSSGASSYLFEPGKSLMKAGPYNLIAQRFAVCKLGSSTHCYLTDSEGTAQLLKSYGKVYRILECHPLDKRSMKEVGKKYPKAEVTARNIPMDTETLRKKTGVTSGDDAHIFGLKSDSKGNLLFVAKREY